MGALFIDCLFVGVGGFIGSVARYLLGFLSPGSQSGFPFITLGINVVGSFLIGFLVVHFTKNSNLDPHLLLFLKVGICGGFTTFSTFSLESMQLIQDGNVPAAVLYIVASVILGLIAVFAGSSIGDWANA